MRVRRSICLFRIAALSLLLCLPGCKGASNEASAAAGGRDSGSEPMEQSGILARASNVELGSGVTVTLDGPEAASRIDSPGSRRLLLLLRGLRASNPPGVLYHLYLGLPAGTKPADDDPRHVGIINFYAAQTGDPAKTADRIFYSFDVTDAVQALRARGLLRNPITLTFHPAGNPEPGAKAVVSRIELVKQ